MDFVVKRFPSFSRSRCFHSDPSVFPVFSARDRVHLPNHPIPFLLCTALTVTCPPLSLRYHIVVIVLLSQKSSSPRFPSNGREGGRSLSLAWKRQHAAPRRPADHRPSVHVIPAWRNIRRGKASRQPRSDPESKSSRMPLGLERRGSAANVG